MTTAARSGRLGSRLVQSQEVMAAARATGPPRALSDQRGSRVRALLTGTNEPQIRSQNAEPVPYQDPRLRYMKHGPVQPMEEPGLLRRLFGR